MGAKPILTVDTQTMQAMITLATLAAIGATERPSGEDLATQAERISTGITTQLANTGLATGNNWQLSWLGLSQDRANLAFIAVSTSLNAIAISIRGTLFSSMIDLGEDLDVGSLAQFTAGTNSATTPPLLVAKGANDGFAEITSAVDVRSGAQHQNADLVDALIQILSSNQVGSTPTLYITGHSLGGALATMVALYLKNWNLGAPVTFAVYTFAAPTAGLQEFAEYYDQVLTNNPPNQTWRVYNIWDAVPNAWASLINLKGFYPDPPGPAQDTDVKVIIDNVLPKVPGNNVYVQTNINTNSYPINNTQKYGSPGTYDPEFVDKTTADFFGQVGFQHNDYVAMLGAPPLGSVAPVVTGVTPNSGTSDGNVLVTINGSGFGPYSEYPTYVDFGGLAGGSSFQVKSDSEIQGYSPTAAGVLDVRVTTLYGTSAVVDVDQYAAPSPTSAPEILSVSPSSGSKKGGTPITIIGGGFMTGSTVTIGGTAATDVVIVSLTEITALTPAGHIGNADVIVTSSIGPSAPAKFTYI